MIVINGDAISRCMIWCYIGDNFFGHGKTEIHQNKNEKSKKQTSKNEKSKMQTKLRCYIGLISRRRNQRGNKNQNQNKNPKNQPKIEIKRECEITKAVMAKVVVISVNLESTKPKNQKPQKAPKIGSDLSDPGINETQKSKTPKKPPKINEKQR